MSAETRAAGPGEGAIASLSASAGPSAVSPASPAGATRMTGAARRDQILAAARRVFAEGGYAASTDEVARAAGVSQPYVVRLFGSKRDLFLAAYRQATAEILAALSSVPPGPDAGALMGDAYVELLADRDLLRLVMHGFIAGTDPEVGREARHCLGEAFRLFTERSGADPDEGRRFVAFGMLINVLMATDAMAHTDEGPGIESLVRCVVESVQERRTE
ncbi:TetR/AcrR family transcriptional regulator [Cellulomonas edaphi]|uniref:Helix-turn-helix domain-containing protein n=1 Tax=Cellulomonas edaphi TaxID=3053468 RepID=A0ABT7SAS5_9CELL|nr:TetR/AcrR family transcriptional regulator [Cellulomons edaphi]MDM7832725.1 helix-turn-helix domain-containing protein [Cellulomons edaphi]